MNMNKVSIYFLKFIVVLLFLLTFVIGLVLVPNIANFAGELYPDFIIIKFGIYLILYGILLCYIYVFYHFYQVLRQIEKKIVFTELTLGILKKIKCSVKIAIIIFLVGLPIFYFLTMDMDPPFWLFTSPIILPLLILLAVIHISEQLLEEVLNIVRTNK